jgi:hypothetical protein
MGTGTSHSVRSAELSEVGAWHLRPSNIVRARRRSTENSNHAWPVDLLIIGEKPSSLCTNPLHPLGNHTVIAVAENATDIG